MSSENEKSNLWGAVGGFFEALIELDVAKAYNDTDIVGGAGKFLEGAANTGKQFLKGEKKLSEVLPDSIEDFIPKEMIEKADSGSQKAMVALTERLKALEAQTKASKKMPQTIKPQANQNQNSTEENETGADNEQGSGEQEKAQVTSGNMMAKFKKVALKLIPEDMVKQVKGMAIIHMGVAANLGDKYGLDNVKVAKLFVKVKDGPDEPGLMETMIALASYDGEGDIYIPQGVMSTFRGFMEFFDKEDLSDNAVMKMVIGAARYFLNILGGIIDMPLDVASKGDGVTGKHNKAAIDGDIVTIENINKVISYLSTPDALFNVLDKFNPADQASKFEVDAIRRLSLKARVDVPENMVKDGLTKAEYVTIYAQVGANLREAGGEKVAPKPETLEGAKKIISKQGIEDPDGELARGLAVMADRSTSIGTILRKEYKPPEPSSAGQDMASGNNPGISAPGATG